MAIFSTPFFVLFAEALMCVNNNLRKKYKLVFLIQSLRKNLRVKSKGVLVFHNNFSQSLAEYLNI